VQINMSDMALRDLAHRTKRYFIHGVIKHLLDRYLITFDNLTDHMFKYFGVCLVLEDSVALEDVINGAQ
jgi:hypothetical protein